MVARRSWRPEGRGVWRAPGVLDRKETRVRGADVPGEEQLYATTPRLAELRSAAGITDEQARELLEEQHHGLGTLRSLESGEAMSRLVVSRVTAALGISHARAKGEIA